MTLGKRASDIIEGIGLVIILISFFVQIIESDIDSEVKEAQRYQIQKKLDDLWIVISKQYIDSHHDVKVHKAINFEGIDSSWKYYSQDLKELNKWQEAVWFNPTATLRIWLFIIGSLMLVVPKFIPKKE